MKISSLVIDVGVSLILEPECYIFDSFSWKLWEYTQFITFDEVHPIEINDVHLEYANIWFILTVMKIKSTYIIACKHVAIYKYEWSRKVQVKWE